MNSIFSFRGDYEFLSSFYPWPVRYAGVNYPTREHAFQAQKTLDAVWHEKIRQAKTPGRAKRLGRQAPIRRDWEEIKISTMKQIVIAQVEQNYDFARRLLPTGDTELIEGNSWGDATWGQVFTSKGWEGRNELGRILMTVRHLLKKELLPRCGFCARSANRWHDLKEHEHDYRCSICDITFTKAYAERIV